MIKYSNLTLLNDRIMFEEEARLAKDMILMDNVTNLSDAIDNGVDILTNFETVVDSRILSIQLSYRIRFWSPAMDPFRPLPRVKENSLPTLRARAATSSSKPPPWR